MTGVRNVSQPGNLPVLKFNTALAVRKFSVIFNQ